MQRKLAGSAFHAEGPATEKACSPGQFRSSSWDCVELTVRRPKSVTTG